MISSLLFQQRPTCLVCLTWMVLKMLSKWPYSSCFVGCCFWDFFNTARNILAQFPSSFSSIHFVSVHVVYMYTCIDTTTAWKKFRLSDRSDFHKIDSLSIVVYAFTKRILILLSVDETLYLNLSTNFRELPFRVEIAP